METKQKIRLLLIEMSCRREPGEKWSEHLDYFSNELLKIYKSMQDKK